MNESTLYCLKHQTQIRRTKDTRVMSQRHSQHGTFHVTTNAHDKIPWCTLGSIPGIIIDNFVATRNIHDARLHAFCILPNHMHMIVSPGEKGLSKFMQSLKSNITKDVHHYLLQYPEIPRNLGRGVPATGNTLCVLRWQNDFFDKRIRDARQLSATFGYVLGNAMHHGLVATQEKWPWSSMHFPHLIDSIEVWLE